jgi:hypothetical protein
MNEIYVCKNRCIDKYKNVENFRHIKSKISSSYILHILPRHLHLHTHPARKMQFFSLNVQRCRESCTIVEETHARY